MSHPNPVLQPAEQKNQSNENSKALEFLNSNGRLKNLMLKALDHAIENLKVNSPLHPFSMTEKEFGEPPSRDLGEAIKQIENYISSLKDEDIAVYSFSGTVGADPKMKVEWPTKNSIFVKGFDRREKKGVFLIQMYQPKTEAEEFVLLGNALVAPLPNILT